MTNIESTTTLLGNKLKESAALLVRVSKAAGNATNEAELARVMLAHAAAVRYTQHIASAVDAGLGSDEAQQHLELADCSRRTCISLAGDLCSRRTAAVGA